MSKLSARLSITRLATPHQCTTTALPILQRVAQSIAIRAGAQLWPHRRALFSAFRLLPAWLALTHASRHRARPLGPLAVYRMWERRGRKPPHDALHVSLFPLSRIPASHNL